jgi:hypothetical protein
MKLHDQETQDLAQAVQDVLEGKVKNECADEKDFKPHMMYDPKTGKGYKANTYDDHVRMDKMGYTHEAPKETYTDIGGKQHNKVKGMHPVKKTSGPGVKEDIDAAHEEALAIEEARQLKDPKKEVMVVKNGKVEVINKKDLKKFMAKGYGLAEDDVKEESDKQKKYQAFFDKALKKFGVKSPSELEGDKKKEFFDYVDANYEADNETD